MEPIFLYWLFEVQRVTQPVIAELVFSCVTTNNHILDLSLLSYKIFASKLLHIFNKTYIKLTISIVSACGTVCKSVITGLSICVASSIPVV